jgi:hypothetical protein
MSAMASRVGYGGHKVFPEDKKAVITNRFLESYVFGYQAFPPATRARFANRKISVPTWER